MSMTPKFRAEILREIARCDREIAEAGRQADAPAILVALWAEDWEGEKRILLAMLDAARAAA